MRRCGNRGSDSTDIQQGIRKGRREDGRPMDGVEIGVGVLCILGGALVGYVLKLAVEQAILKTRYAAHLEYLHNKKGKNERR